MTGVEPLRVLIVDDSRDDAELTELTLRDAGMVIDCRRAAGAAGLSALLSEFRPQVLLSDVNLPGYSGAEAMALARALLPGLPVVFLTGSAFALGDDALPEGDALLLKDDLEQLPGIVRTLVA